MVSITMVMRKHFLISLMTWQYGEINTTLLDSTLVMRSNQVTEMIHLRGFEAHYLPAYTPYINPIENLFSQWKNLVKRANPENIEDLHTAMNDIQNVLTAEQCNNYVQKCNMNCYNYTINGQRVFEN